MFQNERIENQRPDRRPKVQPGQNIKVALQDYSFEEVIDPGFMGGPGRGSSRSVMRWSMAATMIDLLSVLASLCLFLFSMLVLQRVVDPSGVVTISFLKSVVLGLSIFLYVSYLLISRLFLGCTLGEWACSLRVGVVRQRLSARYSWYVIKRFLVTLVTGVIVLPLLSWATGVDWAGRISDVPLVRIGQKGKR